MRSQQTTTNSHKSTPKSVEINSDIDNIGSSTSMVCLKIAQNIVVFIVCSFFFRFA